MSETNAGAGPHGAARLPGWVAWLAKLPANRAFAYIAVVVLQLRAMWGVWNTDLTGGDTTNYFANAMRWSEDLQVNFAWSPLYTSFLGTVDWITGSAVYSIPIHRVLIVLALAVLVLALMRKLLPAWAALLVACWWVSLPIVFDSLYEVHLFAALPLLFVALVLTNEPSLRRRGLAVGLLVAFAVLVRNEAGFVAALVVLAMAIAELVAWRRGRRLPLRQLALAFGLPLLAAAAVIGITYERSAYKGEDLNFILEAKHTLNVCQVYTVNYQQRQPGEYEGSPWTECEPLMTQQFGEPQPSLTEAWRLDTGAMLDFTTWNVRLLPQGMQVALFNGAAGGIEPDYISSRLNWWPAFVLGLVMIALLVGGAIVLRRDWARWQPVLHRQRWAWLALAAVAIVTVAVVVFTQRPRPSYMFGLTAGVMALTALAAAVLVRHRGWQIGASALSAVVPVLLLFALPVHYEDEPTPRRDGYERLEPVLEAMSDQQRQGLVLSVPGEASGLCLYLAPNQGCTEEPLGASVPLESGPALRRELGRRGVELLYVDEEIAANPAVSDFLADPRGWREIDGGETDAGPWAVFEPAPS